MTREKRLERQKRFEEVRFEIGDRLRLIRVAAGLKQRELAELMGVHLTQVSAFECGYNNFSPHWLKRFAKALDVSADEIIGLKRGTKAVAAGGI